MPITAPNITTPTLAPETGRYNGKMVAIGWGSLWVKVKSIRYGMSIMSSEDSTRFSKVVYPQKVTDAGFVLGIVFTTEARRRSVADLLQGYARLAGDPDSGVGPMVVAVPKRKFVRIGIPVRGVDYDDRVGAITYSMDIQFVGTSDPLNVGTTKNLSHVDDVTQTNSMFYPVAVGPLEDQLYDASSAAIGAILGAIGGGLDNGPGTTIRNPGHVTGT